MRLRIGPSLLAVALLAAAGLALFGRSSTTETRREPAGAARPLGSTTTGPEVSATTGTTRTTGLGPDGLKGPLPPNHPPVEGLGERASEDEASLPRNHPAIQRQGSSGSGAPREIALLAWTPPAGWEVTPSRSTLRLATYRVPAATKRGGVAELTVTRAGGSTGDNLDRWVGQFDAAGTDTRTIRTVSGFRVTTLDVSGTYDGGMSSSGPESSQPDWSLLGAVVETPGPFYFFKMVGPTDAVQAARPAFDALLSSVRSPG